jgi:hypothetical protein
MAMVAPAPSLEAAPSQPGAAALVQTVGSSASEVATQFSMNLERLDDRLARAGWSAVAEHADGYRLSLHGAFDDQLLPARSAQSRLGFGPVEAWERSAAFDATATLEDAHGRVRTTTRLAVSQYEAPRDGFRPSRRDGRKQDKDLERFAGVERASGDAVLQRLEATLVEAGPVGLAVFGQFSSIDRWFESAALRDRNDPFLNPGHEAIEGGGTITFGPVLVTLAQSSERDLLDDKGRDAPRKASFQRARAELSLPDLAGGANAAWLPTSLWFTEERGEVRPLRAGTRQDDQSRSWGAGLTWAGDAFDSYIGYWREVYDSRGPVTIDTRSETVDLGVGLYRAAWDIYAGLGVSRDQYPVGTLNAVDHSVDVSVAGGVRLDDLPDLSLAATLSHYLADYPADATFGRYTSWELDAKLDFTKFLSDGSLSPDMRVAVVYGLSAYRNSDGYAGSDRNIDHAIGIVVSVPLQ